MFKSLLSRPVPRKSSSAFDIGSKAGLQIEMCDGQLNSHSMLKTNFRRH